MDTFTLALTNLMQYWNEDYLVLAYILFTTGFNGLSLNFDNSSLNIWINNLSTAKFNLKSPILLIKLSPNSILSQLKLYKTTKIVFIFWQNFFFNLLQKFL